MLKIYNLDMVGGTKSERFRAYCDAGAQGIPIGGYNPMTSELAIETVEQLLAIDAEEIALQAANETAEKIGLSHDTTMHISVAVPGMWTDHLGTEVEHRFKATDPSGVLLWHDAQITAKHIRAEVVAQTVRLGLFLGRQNNDLATLEQAVQQEGTALALAGNSGVWNQKAEDILAAFADDIGLAATVAYLYGDDAAIRMGYQPLGLDDRVGYQHAVAIHSK